MIRFDTGGGVSCSQVVVGRSQYTSQKARRPAGSCQLDASCAAAPAETAATDTIAFHAYFGLHQLYVGVLVGVQAWTRLLAGY